MFLDRIKKILTLVKNNCFLPISFFVFSFVNIIACLVNPINYCSLPELVANDVAHASSVNGLVEFDFKKGDAEFNTLYSWQYYFDDISSKNKLGKSYFVFDEKVINYDAMLKNEDALDYSIGVTNIADFEKLDIKLVDGEIKKDDYNIDARTNHCILSQALADEFVNKYNLENQKDLIGQKTKYVGVDFTIDAIAENKNFVGQKENAAGDKFIVLRYGRINSKTVSYSYHLYLHKDRYYDNYSVLTVLFQNIYRYSDDSFHTLTIVGNEWIYADINWYLANVLTPFGKEETRLFVVLSISSLVFGVIIGLINRFIFKPFSSLKHGFYVMIASVFLYFAGFYLFASIFNNRFIRSIHINVFSSFGSLFAILYFALFFLGVMLFVKSEKKRVEDELIEKPLVSIVIPVYNGANYLRFAIDSSLNQTYENIEIVVVNDGSTDGGETEKVVKSIKDNRIHYFKKRNGGVATALNYGLKKCQGKYVCWLSHDDMLPPEKISYQLFAIQQWGNNDKTIPYSGSLFIDEHGKKKNVFAQLLSNVRKCGAASPKDYFKLEHLVFSSLLIPKDFFDNHEFRKEMEYSQDVFMFFQLLESGYSFKYYDSGLPMYRVHAEQGSFLRRDEFKKDVELIHKEFVTYFDKTKDFKFMKNYFRYCSKKVAGFEEYSLIIDDLTKNKDKYGFNKTFMFLSKATTRVYRFLFKIKRKVYGR